MAAKETSTSANREVGPRPLFIYGTLCAKPLLAWAVTGSAGNVTTVMPQLQPAQVTGYKRVCVHHCDYPAVVKDDNDNSTVDGFVFTPKNMSQRRKLDDFEGEAYKAIAVTADLLGNSTHATVDVDMYLWDGDLEKLSTEPWDLDKFVSERLEDWLDLFEGMEMVGDDDD